MLPKQLFYLTCASGWNKDINCRENLTAPVFTKIQSNKFGKKKQCVLDEIG